MSGAGVGETANYPVGQNVGYGYEAGKDVNGKSGYGNTGNVLPQQSAGYGVGCVQYQQAPVSYGPAGSLFLVQPELGRGGRAMASPPLPLDGSDPLCTAWVNLWFTLGEAECVPDVVGILPAHNHCHLLLAGILPAHTSHRRLLFSQLLIFRNHFQATAFMSEPWEGRH